jgi:hypothetical protein
MGTPRAGQNLTETLLLPLVCTVKAIVAFTLATPVPLPVTVMLLTPVEAVVDAERVSVDVVPVTFAGLNVAVTPTGRPVAARVTVPPKPPKRAMVTVTGTLVPRCTLSTLELSPSVKLPAGAETVSAIAAVCVVTPVALALIATVEVPGGAVLEAVSVSVDVVPVPVTLAGLNVIVTPCGKIVAIPRLIAPEKPPVRVIVTVEVAVAPCTTLIEVGSKAREKPRAGVTASVIVAVRFVTPGLVPVTVTVEEPVAADPEAESVSVEVVPVTLAGLNNAVTPAGNPVADKVTAPAKSPDRVIVTVDCALDPWATLRVVEERLIVKEGWAVTVTEA